MTTPESRWRLRWKAIAKLYRKEIARLQNERNQLAISGGDLWEENAKLREQINTTELRNAELNAVIAAFAAQRVGEVEQRREMRERIAELEAALAVKDAQLAGMELIQQMAKGAVEDRDAAQADAAVARDLVESLSEDTKCRFDHNGHCQEHNWFSTKERCANARACELLATPNPGAPLLAELERLRKQVAADEPEPPEYQRTADPDC